MSGYVCIHTASSLLKELKKIDDKSLLVEVFGGVVYVIDWGRGICSVRKNISIIVQSNINLIGHFLKRAVEILYDCKARSLHSGVFTMCRSLLEAVLMLIIPLLNDLLQIGK